MADKRIQDLTPATSVQTSDRFVLEQSGQAKSLTGQILINDLATALDGHGGVSNISYTEPTSPSLDGTLTITMADETEYYLNVTNGRGISNITWTTSGTAGDGMTHTGTIDYNDGTSSTVTFQDGVQGLQGVQTYVWFKWADDYPTADADMQNNVGAYIGIYSGISSSAPTHYTDYVWYQYKGDTGDTGASIQSISKISTSGLVDTYQVLLTNGNTSNFTVTNAKSISSVTMTSGTHAAGTTDTYTISFNDGDTATFTVYNGANGSGSVSKVSGIEADGVGNVPQVISGNGAPTTATIGQTNQLYFDLNNSMLYYCVGESGGTYTWLGASVTVDSALSGSSTNPVQNKVITNRIGTGVLPNSSSDLTTAINYVSGIVPTAATATPLADTTGGAIGTGTNWAKNDHQHPLNVATSGTPEMDGTAALGSATTYAKTDHVHPSDTSRVDKTGDTMTGDLNINASYIIPKSTNLTNGTTVGSNTQGNGRIQFKDSLGNALGIIYPYFRTDGKQGIRLLADRFIGATEYVATIEIGVESDGSKYVLLPNSTDTAFLKALGLYSVETETTASNIATASSGYSIQTASYARWGHVAMVYLGIKRTNGISSDTSLQPCTLVSGKRPSFEASVTSRNIAVKTAYFSSGGVLNTYQTWEAGATLYFTATYIVP